MGRPINRARPRGPASAYRTYGIRSPIRTHYRPGTCAEINCEAYRSGWRTIVDEATELGRRQAGYIRSECLPVSAPAQPGDQRRRYLEETAEGCATVFTFPPGQRCFDEHVISLERPEIYIARDGDWRGNPRGTPTRVHSGPDPWLNEFATNQAAVIRRINQG